MQSMVKLDNFRTYAWEYKDGAALVANMTQREKEVVWDFLQEGAKRNELPSASTVREKLKDVNGFFSAVVETDDRIIILEDHMGAFPIFYSIDLNADLIRVSDDASYCANGCRVDERGLAEFRATYFTTGSRTIWEGVQGIKGGSFVCINKATGSVDSIRYWMPTPKFPDGDPDVDGLAALVEETFSEIAERYKDRPIYLPFTGGTDSRGLAVFLISAGHKDVRTFTVGVEEDYDVRVAREVANTLGLPWTFVEARPSDWKKYWDSDKRKDLAAYSIQGGRIYHGMLAYGFDKLVQDGLVLQDAVVMPGFCGEIMGQFLQHIPKAEEGWTRERVISTAAAMECRPWNGKSEDFEVVKDVYAAEIPPQEDFAYVEYCRAMVQLHLEHYTERFIFNGVRGYELEGYSWYTPFFTKRWCEYWLNTPLDYYFGKRLYDKYLQAVSEELGLSYSIEEKGIDSPFPIDHPKLYTRLRHIKRELIRHGEMSELGVAAPLFADMSNAEYRKLMRRLGYPKEVFNAYLLEDVIENMTES